MPGMWGLLIAARRHGVQRVGGFESQGAGRWGRLEAGGYKVKN